MLSSTNTMSSPSVWAFDARSLSIMSIRTGKFVRLPAIFVRSIVIAFRLGHCEFHQALSALAVGIKVESEVIKKLVRRVAMIMELNNF